MKITVDILKHDKIGELNPHYDDEANVLEVGTNIDCIWFYGLDVDGSLIFDANENRILVNIDLLIPKKYWETSYDLPDVYKINSQKGIIQFSNDSIKTKSFNFPLKVYTDNNKKKVFIKISDYVKPTLVELSKSCYVYVKNNVLCGFLILL